MKPLLISILTMLAAFAAFPAPADTSFKAANAKSLALVGQPAPDINLSGLDGRPFHLAEHRGKLVVLAFWATWCPPCRSELPALIRLQKAFPPDSVIVAAIAVDDPAKVRSYLEKKGLGLSSAVDPAHAVARLYGANYLPRTFVIGKDGVVLKAFLDKLKEAEVRAAVEAARH